MQAESAAAVPDANQDSRGKGRLRGCARCATPGDYEIYAPLLALPEAQGSELVFNSRSPQAMSVTPIFYKLDGTRIVGEAVKIDSAEIRYVDIRKLIPPPRLYTLAATPWALAKKCRLARSKSTETTPPTKILLHRSQLNSKTEVL